MLFSEELQRLSGLLRISAEVLLQIAGASGENQEQLDLLSMEVDVIADRLVRIGSRIGAS